MNILKTKNIALLLASIVTLTSCSDDDDNSTTITDDDTDTGTVFLPETIEIQETALFPEGIDYNNNNNQFYLSSVMRGEAVSYTHLTLPTICSV